MEPTEKHMSAGECAAAANISRAASKIHEAWAHVLDALAFLEPDQHIAEDLFAMGAEFGALDERLSKWACSNGDKA